MERRAGSTGRAADAALVEMTERLNFANAIRARVDARPGYDPRTLGIGQVHIGLGAFHRAHQALYAELALAARPGPWGIAAVSMRSAAARDQLAPQDGLYALAERSGAGETLRLIGCIRRCLVGGEAAIAAIADPAIRIVTLTVTEKGYCHDPASGRLNPSHSALSQGDAASLPGVLTAGLAARRQAGLGPVTVLCCDNLPHNGRVARQVTLDYAARRDDGLAAWIEREIAFPSTMVDRIVPATTDADRARVAARLGFEDRGAVV
ncbi:MAG: hypothetical protein FJX46_11260, partial [Alphaproteobacteria bacterium]|nr:hypothetical protein [Alphaproteobacteria bacterium]